MQPTSYLCSYPKSGRTWMRFALANLMNQVYELDHNFDLVSMFYLIPNDDGATTQIGKGLSDYRFSGYAIPRPAMSHHPFESRFTLLPAVLLIRNPADAIVSRFHHLSRHQGRFSGTLDDFVSNPDLGVDHAVRYYSSWYPHVEDPNVLVVRYEDLRKEPLGPFSKIAAHLGVEARSVQLEQALSQSTVDKMRALEISGGVGEPHNYDRRDPDALRVRRAKVGGFKDEMGSESRSLVLERFAANPGAMALLNKFDIVPE